MSKHETRPLDIAFPSTLHPQSQSGYGLCGLTKREYLAAKVLQGIAADPECRHLEPSDVAAICVRWTDALIAELNKAAAQP